MVNLIEKIAKDKNSTIPQIALAWVLAQKSFIVPIPGTTKSENLRDNSKAADIKLTDNEIADMNCAISKINIRGDRYPEGFIDLVDK